MVLGECLKGCNSGELKLLIQNEGLVREIAKKYKIPWDKKILSYVYSAAKESLNYHDYSHGIKASNSLWLYLHKAMQAYYKGEGARPSASTQCSCGSKATVPKFNGNLMCAICGETIEVKEISYEEIPFSALDRPNSESKSSFLDSIASEAEPIEEKEIIFLTATLSGKVTFEAVEILNLLSAKGPDSLWEVIRQHYGHETTQRDINSKMLAALREITRRGIRTFMAHCEGEKTCILWANSREEAVKVMLTVQNLFGKATAIEEIVRQKQTRKKKNCHAQR